MQLFILTLIIVGVAVAGIAIKMFFIKGATFKKSCSSETPDGKRLGCVCDDDSKPETCKFYEEHHGKNASSCSF